MNHNKKSIDFLSKNKRIELKLIVDLICNVLGDTCRMIILFGNYADNFYSDYNQHIDYKDRIYFMSDYDMLVITSDNDNYFSINRKLSKLSERLYNDESYSVLTPVRFTHETINNIIKAINKGHYFFTNILAEGIVLYCKENIENIKLQYPDYKEVEKLTAMCFSEKLERADSFFADVENACNRKDYKQSSFYLHQTTENLYFAIILTFTLYSPGEHNLFKLSRNAKSHSINTIRAFPRFSSEEKRLFRLLNDAYLQARYNPHFIVSKSDIDILTRSVVKLRDIVTQVCKNKIAEYRNMFMQGSVRNL